jgi:hypothetical protein
MKKPLWILLAVISACILVVAVAVIASRDATQPIALGDPQASIEAAVRDALGSSNRQVHRFGGVEWNGDTRQITINWGINDNLSSEMIRRGAMMDITTILETLASPKNPYDYATIRVVGFFRLQDVYGNGAETQVVTATYSRDAVDRINWASFLTDNVYAVADELWIHPAFGP